MTQYSKYSFTLLSNFNQVTFLAESDLYGRRRMVHGGKFQSAPSLRKVTTSHGIYGNGRLISIHTFPAKGDKRLSLITIYLIISIHTFFAEGDDLMILGVLFFIISIHTFLAEDDVSNNSIYVVLSISIHTFPAEGD